jgi:hypothetical protein
MRTVKLCISVVFLMVLAAVAPQLHAQTLEKLRLVYRANS